jgi:hypothetical protein
LLLLYLLLHLHATVEWKIIISNLTSSGLIKSPILLMILRHLVSTPTVPEASKPKLV